MSNNPTIGTLIITLVVVFFIVMRFLYKNSSASKSEAEIQQDMQRIHNRVTGLNPNVTEANQKLNNYKK